ncbi:MAG: ribosome silencing factor [Turicibacter sp.]|uniref:Ribosomal silencing factor RsfS n=1 Tax=Turicibacter faecis TaxID=2963365 RepID=A0ABN6ZGG2_9FIRM|nr:ribosome silencing factor [Turicibacter sp.]MCI9351595.1 ribosome silencing factor [Turicibacter sp.]BEH91045.1 ribosomal silencing factor RsfS [Turicibacter sp. TC023]
MEILAKFVKALDDKHADDIVVLDMKNHSPIYDYMIITTAKNDRLAQGIIRELKDLEGISELSLKHIEGAHHAEWVLADFGTIIVHVFTPETRLEYNLEKLWADVPRVNLEGMLN